MDPRDGHQKLPLSLHRYIYSRNNPLMLIDPSGAEPDLISVQAAAAITGVLATEAEPIMHEAEVVSETLVVEAEAASSAASELVQSWTNGVSVWSFNPFVRGNIIEWALGRTSNMVQNYPVIDRFENGVATSIKSIDLTAVSYQNIGNLLSSVSNYIATLEEFNGANVGGFDTVGKITSRVLELAIPPLENGLQADALNALVEYGQRAGVAVQIVVFQ